MTAPQDPSKHINNDVNAGAIDFYWRPGCPFCMRLEHGLKRAGIPLVKRNIWQEPDAATFVRSVAGGNETVPTVRIGSTALVNPSVTKVTETIAHELPNLADAMTEDAHPVSIGKLLKRLLAG